jgi:hypothetical protein
MCCKAAQMVVYHNADDVMLLSGNMIEALYTLLHDADILTWLRGYAMHTLARHAQMYCFVVQRRSVWEGCIVTCGMACRCIVCFVLGSKDMYAKKPCPMCDCDG